MNKTCCRPLFLIVFPYITMFCESVYWTPGPLLFSIKLLNSGSPGRLSPFQPQPFPVNVLSCLPARPQLVDIEVTAQPVLSDITLFASSPTLLALINMPSPRLLLTSLLLIVLTLPLITMPPSLLALDGPPTIMLSFIAVAEPSTEMPAF